MQSASHRWNGTVSTRGESVELASFAGVKDGSVPSSLILTSSASSLFTERVIQKLGSEPSGNMHVVAASPLAIPSVAHSFTCKIPSQCSFSRR